MAPVVQVSIDCGSRRSIRAPDPNLALTTKQGKRNRKKERRVTETGVVYETGVGEGRKCPPASPSSPSNDYYYSHSKERKKAMAKKKDKFVSKKKTLLSNGHGFSISSSSGSNDEFGFFSSKEGEEEKEEEEEETWTLFSSKSFSSDSSEFYHRASSKKKNRKKKSTRGPPRRGAKYLKDSWDEGHKSQPLTSISSREKKEMAAVARSGFAVVKRSSNPFEDFRSSMVEMILERRMSEPEDLEQLLHSYLSLNSPTHHAVILEAFAGICEAIFGES
ncbi:transcription repressor OFP7-like [Cocos nucifera]|uniref:Transcription repressor n=1 Tax=Cocos nucifera TaxID=13894 RepID=A0A8K0IU64_COCNU|nr:transcription repressor OFP7-like [Cocos nucifera]